MKNKMTLSKELEEILKPIIKLKHWQFQRWYRRVKIWAYHICADCNKTDRVLGKNIGNHMYSNGYPHIPW